MNALGNRHLVARLRSVFAVLDPPPRHSYEAARAAFSLRDLDDELTTLLMQSVTDEAQLVGVRGGQQGVRTVCFEGAEVSIELQVTMRGVRRDVLGQVLADGPRTLMVQQGTHRRAAEVDAKGRFWIDALWSGPARCELRDADGRRTVTEWALI
jgi:hypothetical protein